MNKFFKILSLFIVGAFTGIVVNLTADGLGWTWALAPLGLGATAILYIASTNIPPKKKT